MNRCRRTDTKAWQRPVRTVTLGALSVQLFLGLAGPTATADVRERLLIQGLAIGEAAETDSGSTLLSRNEGDPAVAGELLLWQAFEFHPSLHLFAQEEIESESGEDSEAEIEMFLLRFSHKNFTVEAGHILTPIGSFARRHYADVNPLIGEPALYETGYPLGIVAVGAISRLDYRVAAVSKPYDTGAGLRSADHAPRPALGAGVTPITGFRLGTFYTRGPYLERDDNDMLPTGERWRDFDQEVLGFELHFTRGYLVTEGELTISSYEIPAQGPRFHGRAWYLEGRYTWTPRFFTAMRVGENTYPYLMPISPFFWVAAPVTVYDAEIGAGFRLSPTTLLKVSVRRDLWDLDPNFQDLYPDGYSVGIQVSHRFDVLSWFDRPQ